MAFEICDNFFLNLRDSIHIVKTSIGKARLHNDRPFGEVLESKLNLKLYISKSRKWRKMRHVPCFEN